MRKLHLCKVTKEERKWGKCSKPEETKKYQGSLAARTKQVWGKTGNKELHHERLDRYELWI